MAPPADRVLAMPLMILWVCVFFHFPLCNFFSFFFLDIFLLHDGHSPWLKMLRFAGMSRGKNYFNSNRKNRGCRNIDFGACNFYIIYVFGRLNYCVCAENGKGKGAALNGKGHGKSNAARSFTFRQLATATRNFKETNLVGEGGFGKVYKGRLDTGEASSLPLPIFFNYLKNTTGNIIVLGGSVFVYSLIWMTYDRMYVA